jgi:hypothetical protein
MRNAVQQPFGTRVWVGIRVPQPTYPTVAPPPSTDIYFTADRTQISPGQRVLFTWNVRNAQSVYFYAEGDVWQSRSVAFSGQAEVFPQVTTTYSLRVIKNDGTTEIRQITVTVTQPSNAPIIDSFTLSPDVQITLGQCVTISWSTRYANRVRLSRNNTVLWDGAPVTGSTQDCPQVTGQNTYTLEAFGSTTSTRANRTLNVAPSGGGGGVPNINFNVSPNQVPIGGCVTVSWSTSNAVSVRVTRDNNVRLDNGQLNAVVQDCLSTTGYHGYRIEAFSASGQSSVRERGVTVFRPESWSTSSSNDKVSTRRTPLLGWRPSRPNATDREVSAFRKALA